MEIRINNTVFDVADNCGLQALLEQQGLYDSKGIAVAVNDSVAPRDGWADYILKSNDSITIIRATQGG